MNKYLHKFPYINIRHKLELLDKFVLPILNRGCEVLGFHPGKAFELVRAQSTLRRKKKYSELFYFLPEKFPSRLFATSDKCTCFTCVTM